MDRRLGTILALALILCPHSSAQNLLDIECYYNTKAGINGIYVADVNGDGKNEIIAGSYDGNIYLFDTACTKIWSYYATCPVYSVSGLDMNRDGKTEPVGGNCQHIILTDAKGELIWKYRTGSMVVRITSGDINGDGAPEIISGSEAYSGTSSILEIAKADGDALWGKTYKGSRIHGLIAVDINGDGKDEVITGTSKVTAYNSSGDTIWSTNVNGNVEALHHDDINKDGRPEILVGARPTAYLLDNNGGILWSFDTNNTVEDIATYDINSDKNKEILIGSNKVYAVDSRGNPLWDYNTGNMIHQLLVDDLDSDGIPEIIVGSDIIYVLSPEGVLLWKYRTYRDVTGLQIDNGADKRLVAGALDRNVYVFKAARKMPLNLTQTEAAATTTLMEKTTTTQKTSEEPTTTSGPTPTETPNQYTPEKNLTTTNPPESIASDVGIDRIILIALGLIIILAIIYVISNKIRGVR